MEHTKQRAGWVAAVLIGILLMGPTGAFAQSAIIINDPERLADAALLAAVAEDAPSKLGEAVGERGWTVLEEELGQAANGALTPSMFRSGGYFRLREKIDGPDRYADAFVVRRDRTVVIVFQGADQSGDFIDALNDQTAHLMVFDPLFTGVRNYVNNPLNGVNEVVVVGHSFGGALAEGYLRTYAHDLSVHVSGIVFGSIGTNSIGPMVTDELLSVRHVQDPVDLAPPGLVREGEPLIIVLPGDVALDEAHAMETYFASVMALIESPVTPIAPRGVTLIVGSPGPDILVVAGGSNGALILGLAQDDDISGSVGNDYIDGGFGDDQIAAGPGNDIIYGGPGRDFLDGGTGNDIYIWELGTGGDIIVADAGGSDAIDIVGGGITSVADLRARVDADGIVIETRLGDSITVAATGIDAIRILNQNGSVVDVVGFDEFVGDLSPTPGATNPEVIVGEAIEMNGWWSAQGAPAWWLIYDGTVGSDSGYVYSPGDAFLWNGSDWEYVFAASIPAGTIAAVPGDQLDGLVFVAGQRDGIVDRISASPLLAGAWQPWRTIEVLTVNEGPSGGNGFPAPPALPSGF